LFLHIYSTAIQRDWNNRDFVETIQLNVLQIAEFLNEFERSTKTKLASVNEKMSKLERTIEYCEAAVGASLQPPPLG
jgi:chromosome 3 open reading frame 10